MPRSPYLSQTDTLMWMVEADPLLRSTMVAVILLDAAPEWERLRSRMVEVVDNIPVLREKVAPVPLHPTLLRWQPDDEFDLAYHLRRISLPVGSSMQDLLDWARSVAAGGFDPTRPLWEFALVEGVQHDDKPDGAALVMKGHHVVTDGIGAVQLAAHLFDFQPERAATGPRSPVAAAVERRRPDPVAVLREVVARDVEGVLDFSRRQISAAVPTLLQAIRDPRRAARDLFDAAASIGRVVAPAMVPKSPVMVGRTTAGSYRLLDVPVTTLHDAANRAGGRLNDGYIAGITTGLHRYHRHHGIEVDELRAAIPISLRTADDEPGGNHITIMRFPVPVRAESTEAHIRALRSVVDRVRGERSLEHTSTIAGALNLMPKGVVGTIMKGVDFLASNVPGVPQPMWLESRRVTGFYAFGPTAGAALNVTLMTYDGTCYMGVNADAAAVPDPDVLLDCLRAGFDEVCALGGKRRPVNPRRAP